MSKKTKVKKTSSAKTSVVPTIGEANVSPVAPATTATDEEAIETETTTKVDDEVVVTETATKVEEEDDQPATVKVILTEEDFENNPDFVAAGLKPGDEIEVPAMTDEELEQHMDMAPYLETYPDEKQFWISSDGSVFLNKNQRDAVVHQKFIDPKKELIGYTVN